MTLTAIFCDGTFDQTVHDELSLKRESRDLITMGFRVQILDVVPEMADTIEDLTYSQAKRLISTLKVLDSLVTNP